MYTLAGAGMMWTDIDVYPDKRQASGQILHGQDEWFTCDVTATGEVTVRALTDYVTPDGAVTYQTMKEWYESVSYTHLDVYKRQPPGLRSACSRSVRVCRSRPQRTAAISCIL